MTSPRLNRDTFQHLADLRVAEARILLDNGYYSGAYYLAGYAVECALKACIAKQVREYDFPSLRIVRRSHDHKLSSLVVVAGLDSEIQREIDSNQDFSANWKAVDIWTVESRYETHSSTKANTLFSAVTNTNTGVLPWRRGGGSDMVLYSDILSREKIEAGKAILDQLVQEGWEIEAAAWIRDDGFFTKRWSLHFSLRLEDPESRHEAFVRVTEMEKACLAEMYDCPLNEDTFDTSVTSKDDLLMRAIISKYPIKHPIGQRANFHFMDNSWDFFIYNLNQVATGGKSR